MDRASGLIGIKTEDVTAPGAEVRRGLHVFAACAPLVAAIAFRAYRIDAQSLWYDEGVSAAMAPRSLVDITVRSAADIHPPLYYYVLHLWSSFAGTSELALRWLSLAWGVLLVAVVYALGRRLFNSQVGFFAAVFAAMSPFLVYYSQEARMYSQVAFLASLSFYLFVRIIPRLEGSRGTAQSASSHTYLAAVYVLVTSAMLYSHYFSFTILLAQNLVALMLLVRSSLAHDRSCDVLALRRNLEWWLKVQILVVATYVPWLVLTADRLQSWPSISEMFSLATLLRRVFLVFTFGLPYDAASTPNRELIFYVLGVAALLVPLVGFRRKYSGSLSVALYLAVPVLAMYALSLQRPMYNPKFLLLAVPGYCLALALGLENLRQVGCAVQAWIWRALIRNHAHGVEEPSSKPHAPQHPFRFGVAAWSAALALTVLALAAYPMGKSLAAYHFDAKYARDNYRGLVESIASRSAPGDAVILNAPGQEEIFGYYYRQDNSVYPLPRQRPVNEAETAADLQSILEKHSRVWLVLWATAESDPRSFVEHWLDQNSFKTENRWFGNIRLASYSSGSSVESNSQEIGVKSENGIQLRSVRYGTRLLEPGDSVDLVFTWEAARKIDERFTVFVHIIDENEILWGQMDAEPAGGSRPTDQWAEGMKIEDRRGIPVLPGTPPGEYQLEAGLYQPQNGRRLSLLDESGKLVGDRFLFGPIKVVGQRKPPDAGAPDAQRRLAAFFANGTRLLGVNLNPLGRDGEGAVFVANDMVHLTLFWMSVGPTGADASIQIDLRDESGRLVKTDRRLLSDRYPTSKWRAGGLIRDQYKLPLGDLASGEYTISITQLDPPGNIIGVESSDAPSAGGAVQIGRMRVK